MRLVCTIYCTRYRSEWDQIHIPERAAKKKKQKRGKCADTAGLLDAWPLTWRTLTEKPEEWQRLLALSSLIWQTWVKRDLGHFFCGWKLNYRFEGQSGQTRSNLTRSQQMFNHQTEGAKLKRQNKAVKTFFSFRSLDRGFGIISDELIYVRA